MPPTLPRGTSPGTRTRFARFGAPVDDPRKPAGEHEHSGRPQPALQREAMFSQFLGELRKLANAAHHQHQRGSAEGWCVALLQASTCAARPWATPLEYVQDLETYITRRVGRLQKESTPFMQ